jgi:hypothetical protein
MIGLFFFGYITGLVNYAEEQIQYRMIFGEASKYASRRGFNISYRSQGLYGGLCLE